MKYRRKVSYLNNRSSVNRAVPFVRLSGKWLEEIGFNIGSSFIIAIHKSNNSPNPQSITLTPIDPSIN